MFSKQQSKKSKVEIYAILQLYRLDLTSTLFTNSDNTKTIQRKLERFFVTVFHVVCNDDTCFPWVHCFLPLSSCFPRKPLVASKKRNPINRHRSFLSVCQLDRLTPSFHRNFIFMHCTNYRCLSGPVEPFFGATMILSGQGRSDL